MRAHRYPLTLPLRYRVVGTKVWSTGTTANISRSGVLFRGNAPLDVETDIELGIKLSAVSSAGDLVCRARVVRTEPSTTDPAPLLAAAFSNYRFEAAHP